MIIFTGVATAIRRLRRLSLPALRLWRWGRSHPAQVSGALGLSLVVLALIFLLTTPHPFWH